MQVRLKHGGPKYRDPNTEIKSSSLPERLAKFLNPKLTVQDKIQERNNQIDSMYDNFVQVAEKDTYLTVSQFQKYEMLYSRELQQKFLNRELDEDTINQIEELSNEFYNLVNVQKPIHIVDDVTGEEVMPPLPPLFMKMAKLRGNSNEAIDIFHNACINDDHVPGGLGELQRVKATAYMRAAIAGNQNQEDIIGEINKFDTLANNFHKEVLGQDIYHQEEQQQEEAKAKNEPKAIANDADLFDFGPVEE